MKNKDTFYFKKFEVFQGNASMKVGTDGVLLGALVDEPNKSNILDVGAGTGLISLMIAQRSAAKIEAIEIDNNAQLDCELNFNNSPWKENLSLFKGSLQDYCNSTLQKKFDLVVSNPPYFNKNSNKSSRSIARSQSLLSFKELIESAYKLTTNSGEIYVIIPYSESNKFLLESEEIGWHLKESIQIRGNIKSKIKRLVLSFSKTKNKTIYKELCIELEERHQYSKEYSQLLKDYLTIF